MAKGKETKEMRRREPAAPEVSGRNSLRADCLETSRLSPDSPPDSHERPVIKDLARRLFGERPVCPRVSHEDKITENVPSVPGFLSPDSWNSPGFSVPGFLPASAVVR
jgi:hypothetical protein